MSTRKPPTAEECFSRYSAQERVRALRYYFGRPDADADELARLTGLSPHDITTRPHGGERLNDGFSAIRTCTLEWRRDTLTPNHLGEWPYWRDAIAGFWATGSLDREDPRYPAVMGR